MARVEVFARTEVGCVRERNEDAFAVAEVGSPERGLVTSKGRSLDGPGTLVGVCDGMGGAAAGDIASQIAADQLVETIQNGGPYPDKASAQAALIQAMANANRGIAQHAAENPAKRGMGSTMTAALFSGPELQIVHIGDSRAYLLRGRTFQQLTTDHSLVGQMIASGQLSPDQARDFEHRNVLLQALGVQQVISPELVVVPLRAGDVVMLCSDGLTGPLTDQQILDILLKYGDPVRCCRALTEAACASGGPDNITVAVVRVVGEGLPLPRGREPIEAHRVSHTTQ